MTDEKTTDTTETTTEFQPKLYKLDDNVIGMCRELVQLSLLLGQNIVDHLRALVVEESKEDPRYLTLNSGYVEAYNKMILELNEQATEASKAAEQQLAKQQDVPPSVLDS